MAENQAKPAARGSGGSKSEIAAREEETLSFWNERGIFKQSLEKDAPKGEFVFYDGPPFATGLPHYGHLLQSAVKDAIPRYKTMQGYRVERQWGWDCHGLPIENIVEKEIGTKSKKDIINLGVKKFNDLCRQRIFTFTNEWERIIPRFGRWADMEHPFRTMDFSYMESEWWAFKKLHDSGLIYEDYRSMHICPRCETTLSQSEVAEGYRDVKDIAVTVKFKLKPGQKIGDWEVPDNTFMLAWTTTPWTLPGNVALAVGKDIQYAATKSGEVHVVAKDVLEKYPGDVIAEFAGVDLVGLEYEPPFDYYISNPSLKNRENGWKVYAADFVTADEGTGIAHEAPAFGADDWELLKKENLPFVQHVNMDGTMKPEVTEFAGMEVKPRSDDDKVRLGTDISVLKYLQEHGFLFAKENITHPYPHCWRCDTPLLNYATSSWFVSVTKLKDQLLKNAEVINWSPKHIKTGRWGRWLEGARDWSISRQRFWANTIPVWRCAKCRADQVFGSVAELEAASGTKVVDLHKDIVDAIAVPCECGGTAQRIPDVLDTWFDSGSVPFATEHYPFENQERFKARTPADFIGEAADQTRAWFYYQHVLAGALFDAVAFKNVIVTGLVLAEDGKKMSKKLQNYPDPVVVMEKYGADAMRFYMLSSPAVAGENLNFSEKGVDEVAKKNIGRLGNVLAFWQLYDDGTPRDWKSAHVLDRWIVARLAALIAEATDGFEKYELDRATRPLSLFIDDLSVWYLRRSRDRLKSGGTDTHTALATLRYVLHALSKVMAPSMPFFAEHLFQAVREEEDEESVHLAMWPKVPDFAFDAAEVLTQMLAARIVVSQALKEREQKGINVRQPLATLSIPAGSNFSDEYLAIIADEVNVKEVLQSGASLVLKTSITPDLKEEGCVREAKRLIQDARREAKLQPSEIVAKAVLIVDAEKVEPLQKHADELKDFARVREVEIVSRGTHGEKKEVVKIEK